MSVVFAVTPDEGFTAETLCNEVGHYLPGDATRSDLLISLHGCENYFRVEIGYGNSCL